MRRGRAKATWENAPKLLLTAPHVMPAGRSQGREPWGTTHLRRDGETMSVCGLPTATWITFWDRAFQPLTDPACRDCAQAWWAASAAGAQLRPVS